MDSQNLSKVLVENVKLNEISDNILRFDFYSQRHIDELIQSIKSKGLLEALLVHKNNNNGILTLLDGHYRIRALKRMGIKEASCRLLDGNEEESIANYLASFIKKNSVTALEEGHIILELIKRGYSLERIGLLWGKSASWTCRRVKLVKALEEEIKEKIKGGTLSPRIAQELARLPQGNEQKRVFDLVVKNKLTKDETSKLVDKWISSDEKGKTDIEKNYSVKMPQNYSHRSVSSPDNMLKLSVLQCCKSISNLINCIEYVKNYRAIWPWSEYENLCKQFNHVAAYLGADFRKEAAK